MLPLNKLSQDNRYKLIKYIFKYYTNKYDFFTLKDHSHLGHMVLSVDLEETNIGRFHLLLANSEDSVVQITWPDGNYESHLRDLKYIILAIKIFINSRKLDYILYELSFLTEQLLNINFRFNKGTDCDNDLAYHIMNNKKYNYVTEDFFIKNRYGIIFNTKNGNYFCLKVFVRNENYSINKYTEYSKKYYNIIERIVKYI